jgi:prepilin-type N-terminal cleavage/methylation domain-containing protein
MSVTRPKNRRAGFTLVELLVVIAIIGVLSALLTVGLYAAFNSARTFELSQSMTQVQTAVEQFKTKYGTYPPDMSDVSDPTILPGSDNVNAANMAVAFPYFTAFINKAYPRADRNAIAAFCNHIRIGGGRMDQAEALVFFLAASSKDPRFPLGRLANPANPPINANYVPPQPNEYEIFYEFPTLVDFDGDGFREFSQKGAKGAPLVYFDARTYTSVAVVSGMAQVNFVNNSYAAAGTVTPYASAKVGSVYTFYNPKSYQIVCAGLDGEFGVDLSGGIQYPVLSANAPAVLPRLTDTDGDNIGNFTSGQKFDTFTAQ